MQNWSRDYTFQRRLLWLNGGLPAIFLLIDFCTGRLGANPPEAVLRTTGVLAILFLVLSLAVTPLARVFQWNWLPRHRRWLGLWCFYYALLHLLAYSYFDKALVLAEILSYIQKRPFILFGFASFLLLLPLAVTSTNRMIQRLGGKRWKNLHRLSYLIAVLAAAHYWQIVKSDYFYPASFGGILALLLLYRLATAARELSGKRN